MNCTTIFKRISGERKEIQYILYIYICVQHSNVVFIPLLQSQCRNSIEPHHFYGAGAVT
jgi:hypothetical protein